MLSAENPERPSEKSCKATDASRTRPQEQRDQSIGHSCRCLASTSCCDVSELHHHGLLAVGWQPDQLHDCKCTLVVRSRCDLNLYRTGVVDQVCVDTHGKRLPGGWYVSSSCPRPRLVLLSMLPLLWGRSQKCHYTIGHSARGLQKQGAASETGHARCRSAEKAAGWLQSGRSIACFARLCLVCCSLSNPLA